MEMLSGVLQSKFYIPSIPSNFISRPEVLPLLQAGLKRKLTLISAPAGFGKSSLVADWLGTVNCHYMWMSINREDNDPIHLVKCLIQGFRKIKKNFGEDILKNLNTMGATTLTEWMHILINEMENQPDDFLLIIDDYHDIRSQVIQEGLSYFLNNMPHQCHLYLICRVDPPIPLSRLKVDGELVEIREKDLRFDLEQTAAFLKKVTSIQLSPQEIDYCYKISEGWCAGLRMIGFSIKTREDTRDILKIVKDSGREISYYLEEEIFSLQSTELQVFLLETSILSTLTPSLCDAVTGRTDSLSMLKKIEKLNLFIILLDHESSLYRYHHFFSDMLQARLVERTPEKVPPLHLKASDWYLKNHLIEEAVYHADASGDELFYADMIERNAEQALIKGEFLSFDKWIEKIPGYIIKKRPRLMIYKSIVLLLVRADTQQVEYYLKKAESHLQTNLKKEKSGQTGTSKGDLHTMLGRVNILKAVILAMYNQYSQAKTVSLRVLEYAVQDEFSQVLSVLINGYCSLTEGKIDDAEVHAWKVRSFHWSAFFPHIEALRVTMTILIELYRGKLSHADAIVSEAISKNEDRFNSQDILIEPYAILLVLKGEILREQNLLEDAKQYLTRGIRLIQHAMPPNIVAYGYICLARVAFSNGNMEDAQEIAENLEKKYWPVDLYLTDYLPAFKAKLDIMNGNLEKAGQYVRKCHFSQKGDIVIQNDIHYSEFLTISRFHIIQKDYQEAIGILEKILEQSGKDGRMRRYLEGLVLLALALKKKGKGEDALLRLKEAVQIAAPEGYCRIFLDEGRELTDMLADLLNHPERKKDPYEFYIEMLIQDDIQKEPPCSEAAPPKKNIPLKYHLDPLTKREQEVLYQLSLGLKNQEIADKLCISLATVKTHIHKILSKLSVDSRNKAIIEARKAGLIE